VKIPLHTAGSGIKLSSIRVPLPKAYSGDEDIKQFDGWLHSMLRWMKINHYAGPEHECDRITLTAMYLDKKAKTWFNDNVKGINCRRRVWTFKDVITGPYDQFIHESSIQDATQKFYAVKYATDGGVYGFYHELEHYALRMIHVPDSYTFNTQLMMGLLSSMIWLVIDKGVTAEMLSLNEILHMAKCVEEGNKVMRQYDDHCRVGVTTPSHSVRVAQPSHPSPTSSWPVQSTRSTPALPATQNLKHQNDECPTRAVSRLIVNE